MQVVFKNTTKYDRMNKGDTMSRMDRYYTNEINKRTSRNQNLYDKIYEASEYSNIEGIANIDNSSEIDVDKIKKMLKNYEDNSSRELRNYDESRLEVPKYETLDNTSDRVYDIRDILSKAKDTKEEDKYHYLDATNVNLLKELKEKTKAEQEQQLTGMIDTITNTSKLNKLSDQDLGLDMFEDLKSNNTILPGKESIKSILEEAKKQENVDKTVTSTTLDKSFFTSSLGFKEQDFEEITELNKKVKKNNLLIKILFFIILIAVTVAAVVFVFNLLK